MSSDPSTILDIQNISKCFTDFLAVDNVSFTIHRGEFFSLLGPSGCGKTTLLRIIAGLESPSQGTLVMDGEEITRVPPYQRKTNMVFQHYALFPHLSVFENIRFGLRYLPLRNTSDDKEKIDKVLKLVRLSGLEHRRPNELSGGQRQRVALARALILEPKILLLDEPLGALDQKLRKEMQLELKNLQRNLGITFILVTHDQEEALTMSDRIAVMNHGKIEQIDAASVVFERPRTAFVASFMDASNLFEGIVRKVNDRTVEVESSSGFSIHIPSVRELEPSKSIQFVVRPENMKLSSSPDPKLTNMQVMIEDRVYKGSFSVWIVTDQRKNSFTLIRHNHSEWEDQLNPKSSAYASWDPKDCVLLH